MHSVKSKIRQSVNHAPVFIVGAHRSGSTLLRVMMDHHPQIALPHEFDFTMHLVGAGGEAPDLEVFYDHLAMNGSYIRSGFEIDRSLDFSALLNSFLEQAHGEKPIVGMSCHANFDRLPYFWPEARYIHLVRDPRDVAPSAVQLGIDGSLYTASARWAEAEAHWERLRDRIPVTQYVELRFEDLLTHPRQELSRICEFLGLEYDELMLSYPDHSDFTFPDPTASQRWRSKLSTQRLAERDIQLIEAQVEPWLSLRGYQPSGLKPLQLGIVDKVYYRLGNSLGQLQSDAKRNGWSYALMIRLARWAKRLGMPQLYKRVQQDHLRQNAFCVKRVRIEG